MEICLKQRISGRYFQCSGVDDGGTNISENSGIDTADKTRSANVGISTNPVVWNWLIGGQYERIALARKYLDGIDEKGTDVDAINLNYCL